MIRKTILFLLLLTIPMSGIFSKEVPSGGEMMIDAVLARPLGLASVLIGSALFIVSSPFSLASKSFLQSGKRLVVYPIRFTFKRSLGDFPGYMEELELESE